MNSKRENKRYQLAIYESESDQQDWYGRPELTENEINSIDYSISSRFESGLNSIPSPFARLHLVDTAFSIISEDGTDIDGNSIYHKLVSYTLDVLEIIFRQGELGSELSVKSISLSQLSELDLKNPTHRLLRNTLELYLGSDFSGLDKFYLFYHGGSLIGVTSPHTVVCPSANLFFTQKEGLSREQLARINEYKVCDRRDGLMKLDNHHFFKESGIKSLTERGEDFIEFLFNFAALHKLNESNNFRNFWKYLSKVRSLLQASGSMLYDEINDLNDADVQIKFDMHAMGDGNPESEIYKRLTDAENNPVQFSFLDSKAALEESGERRTRITLFGGDEEVKVPKSDFYIETSREDLEKLPLVLQNGFKGDARYLSEYWNDTIEVPAYRDLNPNINKRFLPDGGEYPFLVEGDFLEDFIVQLPYEIDPDFFHVPSNLKHYDEERGTEYLLPIKRTYFEYFNLADLDKYFSMEVSLDQNRKERVYVTLKIPISSREYIIEFKKWYFLNPGIKGDQAQDGKIIKSEVDLALFPIHRAVAPVTTSEEDLVEFEKRCNSFFKLMVVDQDKGMWLEKKCSLKFYDLQNLKTEIKSDAEPDVRQRQKKQEKNGLGLSSEYFELHQRFDLIEVLPANQGFSDNGSRDYKRYYSGEHYSSDTRGLLIPKWRDKPMQDGKFHFSIDFGTTNTHIAFKDIDDRTANVDFVESFEYSIDESPVAVLRKGSHLSINSGVLIQNTEFVPVSIGREDGLPFHFPIRTVVCENRDFHSSGSSPSLFGNVNIGFNYEKQNTLEQSKYVTNLKWKATLSGKDANRVEVFFEEILLLIKSKIIAHGGDISKSRIVWSYPLSMGPTSLNSLREKWEKSYKKVFLGNSGAAVPENFCSINESLAPYFYLKNVDQLKDEQAEMVNIDIGGETVDVLFLEGGSPKYNSSFRFGANKLWGEGFSRQPHNDNGFIKNYINFRQASAIGIESEFKEFLNTRAGMLGILKQILDSTSGGKKLKKQALSGSHDIISFLFNFEEELEAKVTFFDSVSNALRMKSILYIHFSAIIYHLAQTIDFINRKEIKFNPPRNLIFTGNGSKYLSMLGSPEQLQDLCIFIFEHVCKNPLPQNFKVIFPDNPKEVTANGGVLADTRDLEISNDEHQKTGIKSVIFAGVSDGHDFKSLLSDAESENENSRQDTEDLWSKPGKYSSKSKDKAKRIKMDQVLENKEVMMGVLHNVMDFYHLIKDYHLLDSKDWVDFDEDIILQVFKGTLEDGYKTGLRRQADEKGIHLEESLFFYPLIESMYQLSQKLVKRP